MGSTPSMESLLMPRCPTLIAGLVTLQFFKNCFPRSSVAFPVCFFVFVAVIQIWNSGVGGGSAGGASAPPNISTFWKFGQNPWKSEQNPQISRKNLWKFWQKWRPKLFYLKKLSPQRLQDNKWRPFFKGHTKKRSAKLHKNFLGKIGKIWAKILCTPKNLIAPTPMVRNICLTDISHLT